MVGESEVVSQEVSRLKIYSARKLKWTDVSETSVAWMGSVRRMAAKSGSWE